MSIHWLSEARIAAMIEERVAAREFKEQWWTSEIEPRLLEMVRQEIRAAAVTVNPIRVSITSKEIEDEKAKARDAALEEACEVASTHWLRKPDLTLVEEIRALKHTPSASRCPTCSGLKDGLMACPDAFHDSALRAAPGEPAVAPEVRSGLEAAIKAGYARDITPKEKPSASRESEHSGCEASIAALCRDRDMWSSRALNVQGERDALRATIEAARKAEAFGCLPMENEILKQELARLRTALAAAEESLK